MSIWNILDRGMSMPVRSKSWRNRFTLWLGRKMALRNKNVIIPKSCRIHPGAKIHPRNGKIIFGENCILAEGAIIQGNVTLGDDCSIQSYTILVGYGSIEEPTGKISVGNGVRIASHGMMIAGNHRFKDTAKPIHQQGVEPQAITIEDNVWIGGRVNITAGVTIKTGSVIAAGAVVTKDVPPHSVAMGIPAKSQPIRSEERR